MASFTSFIRILVTAIVTVNLFSLTAYAAPAPTQSASNPFPTGLKVFEYVPLSAPYSAGIENHPLQFNGSVPGAADTDQQVGWFFGKTPSKQNKPVVLYSFVQSNKKKGIVFWAENTALQTYLLPVPGAEGTYAARNGYTKNPKALMNDFTIDQIHIGEAQKWVFGWHGNYKSWFVCRKGGFLGLYFGKHIKGCSEPFFLEAKYL